MKRNICVEHFSSTSYLGKVLKSQMVRLVPPSDLILVLGIVGIAGQKYNLNNEQPQTPNQSQHAPSQGNVCEMRIIVDRFLLETFDNNKERLVEVVNSQEKALNELYENNSVKVQVGEEKLPIKFKVVDLVFQDEDFCRQDNMKSVGCIEWKAGEELLMLAHHARSNHSDVCLAYLFTSHNFTAAHGSIQGGIETSSGDISIDSLIFDGRLCLHWYSLL